VREAKSAKGDSALGHPISPSAVREAKSAKGDSAPGDLAIEKRRGFELARKLSGAI